LQKLILTLVFSVILLSSVISFQPAYALNLVEIIKLVASDAAEGDQFGNQVSISGDTAIVGAIKNEAAYVFEKVGDTWTQVAKLTASDDPSQFGKGFGSSVSISGDTAIVGAPNDDDACIPFDVLCSSGAAYVFVKPVGGWVDATEDAKLTASDAADGDFFGDAVSISGNTAIAGAIHHEHAPAPATASHGAAFVFVKPGGGWVDATEDAELTLSSPVPNDFLGWPVSISGDTALVGAIGAGVGGFAFIFEKPGGGWVDATEDATLRASDFAALDAFGQSVSISGDTAIVGSFADDDACPADPACNSGSAYVFVKPGGGWVDATEDAKLTASDAAFKDIFGLSVSISGNTAIVGKSLDDDVCTPFDIACNSGAAYVFVKPGGGWVDATEDQKLTASDAAEGDGFGFSVSISGNTAIVGSFADDDACPADPACNSGSAYIFGPEILAVGGELIPLDTTMVLVAGTHSVAAWMIPVIVSGIGIGIVIARKF